MLGIMLITAIFSMFMSNTATTAMMLAVLTPVLAALPAEDKGRIGFVLAVPFAANIGGIGTPIGTPPNAVAMNYLVDPNTGQTVMSFAGWMAFAVPYVAVVLFLAWIILSWMYKPKTEKLELTIKGKFLWHPKAITVYVVSALTVLLWLTAGSLHSMKSYTVALLPVGVFSAAGIITAKDLKTISWDVLWLVSGGFALGLALAKTGLSAQIVQSIPFDSMSPLILMISAGLITSVMATFMSNTATANLLLPLLAALGVGMQDQLSNMGGVIALLLAATFCASLSMSLPISTPPNAMAHATGMIQTKHMAKAGVLVGIVGIVLAYGLVFILNAFGYFNF